jgi:L-galactose dehydrogenase
MDPGTLRPPLQTMEYRTLGKTGLKVSRLGFGAATLGNEYGTADPQESARAVNLAIDSGINIFDVAPYYGRTLAETRLGEMVEGRRHEVIIATKCARYDKAEFDFSAGRVTQSIDESLRRLKTDYVDILHVHDIEFAHKRQVIDETIPALRNIQAAGKARFIGITGLTVCMLREIAEETDVDCLLSYCRYNLMNTDMASTLFPLAEKRGVGLMNASPLYMRLLTPEGPLDWHPASAELREVGRQVVDLCKRRGASPSKVALHYASAPSSIASTFVGISTQEEVLQNIGAIDATLDLSLLDEIDKLAEPVRHRMWKSGLPENYDRMMTD